MWRPYKTDGQAFLALKEFYARICATPFILDSAWNTVGLCRDAAREEFAQYCLSVYLGKKGGIEVEMRPHTLTLYGPNGEGLSEAVVIRAYTKEEIQKALDREGVVTVSVTFPNGKKAFAGPVDVVRARFS